MIAIVRTHNCWTIASLNQLTDDLWDVKWYGRHSGQWQAGVPLSGFDQCVDAYEATICLKDPADGGVPVGLPRKPRGEPITQIIEGTRVGVRQWSWNIPYA